jgi:hypothetical protein
MNKHVKIDEAIDDVFSNDAEGNADIVSAFMDRLHESQRSATASLYRRTFLFLFLWLVGYLIAIGAISEAEEGGVHVDASHLASLLPAFPIAIGFIAYELACAIEFRVVTGKALSRCYWHVLPNAWSHDLEKLAGPYTYFDVEGVYQVAIESEGKAQKVMANYVPLLVGVILLLGPAVAISHLTYLGWRTPTVVGKILLATSAFLGGLFWLRGILLLLLEWKGPTRVRVKPASMA